MVQAPAEISEAEADGKIKDIYTDIRNTLRVPTVGRLFRMLAVYPDYLSLAWRELKPNAQTVYFELRADVIRGQAVESVAGLKPNSALSPPEGTQKVVRAFHYANPKLFLTAVILRSATSGQQPKLSELPPAEKRQISPGVPGDMADITLPEVGLGDGALENDILRALRTNGVDDMYLALSQWPDYLSAEWQVWKLILEGPEFRRIQRALNRTADESISALPFRVDSSPHTLRHAGLSEQQIDSVRSLLTSSHGAGAAMVAHAAYMSVIFEGRETSRESPFPAASV